MAVRSLRVPEPNGEKDGTRIGYVLKRYPRLSETFIVQEILQMEQRGADLVMFPIMDSGEKLRNPAVDEVHAPVHYLQRSFWRDLPGMIVDHGRLLASSPGGYVRGLQQLTRSRRSGFTAVRTFLQAGRLALWTRREGVSHLHAHFAHNPAALAQYAHLFTGLPYSFTAHAKDLYLSAPASLRKKAKRATFVSTCTAFNATYLQSVLPEQSHDKVHVVYHGVDTRRFRPPKTREANPVPCLVAVGRLVPKKGHAYLVEAAHLLDLRGVAFQLEIYGDGPQRDALHEQIATAGLETKVRLQGACTQDELIAVYQAVDVFVLASVVTENGDRDGIPNVILEAMACGLPVVSTDISGIPEVVRDGVNGRLVTAGGAGQLADALWDLMSSPRLRSELGRAARETVIRSFDATDNAERMASLLQIRGLDAHRVRAG